MTILWYAIIYIKNCVIFSLLENYKRMEEVIDALVEEQLVAQDVPICQGPEILKTKMVNSQTVVQKDKPSTSSVERYFCFTIIFT